MKKLTAIALALFVGLTLAQTTTVTRTAERWTGFQGETRISLSNQFYTKNQCEEFFIKRNSAGTFQCRAESTLTIRRTDPPPPPPPVVNPPVTSMPSGFTPRAPFPTGVPGSGSIRTFQTGENVAVAGDGTGNFRTTCDFSHMAYDDPIVFPGQPGRSHLHSFFGNKLTTGNSTSQTIASTGNSTCRGGIINRSAYWVPSFYDTVTGQAIAPRSVIVYYKSGYQGVRPADVQPFPVGLRMIAGDPKNTTAGDPYGGNAWRYNCHDALGVGVPDMAGPTPPNCPVGSELWAQVHFPQCHDGTNLDAPDHKSHMAYANGSNPARPGVAKGCPASHPVALPELTFNVTFPITRANQTRTWRLVSDVYTGPAGYSMHGDFMMGWQPEFMDMLVKNCINTAGDCHAHLIKSGLGIE